MKKIYFPGIFNAYYLAIGWYEHGDGIEEGGLPRCRAASNEDVEPVFHRQPKIDSHLYRQSAEVYQVYRSEGCLPEFPYRKSRASGRNFITYTQLQPVLAG
ncbi:hypothetical protein ES703_125508 [subsurface metagenome]